MTLAAKSAPVHRASLPATTLEPASSSAGWVCFTLDTHDRWRRECAARSGRVVIGIAHAQAPEHRFPGAPFIDVMERLVFPDPASRQGPEFSHLQAASLQGLPATRVATAGWKAQVFGIALRSRRFQQLLSPRA